MEAIHLLRLLSNDNIMMGANEHMGENKERKLKLTVNRIQTPRYNPAIFQPKVNCTLHLTQERIVDCIPTGLVAYSPLFIFFHEYK